MRYTNQILVVLLLMVSSCFKHKKIDIAQAIPEYRLLHRCSKKIKEDTQLDLRSYGINNNKPIGYKLKNGTYNFGVSYNLYKTQQDTISVEFVRGLVVSVVECLLNEINSDLEVKDRLDVFPITSDLIEVCIYIKDENHIELGTGVSCIYFNRDKLKYKGYNIKEYRSHPPAVGKHYTILEETYAEALEAVKKDATLNDLTLHKHK